MKGRAALVFIIALISSGAAAQSIGSPPTPLLAFRDIRREFALPPLKDARNGEVGHNAANLQVMLRADALGVSAKSADEAWSGAGAQYENALAKVNALNDGEAAQTLFSGTKVSELNAVLRSTRGFNLRVTSKQLIVDEPLRLQRSGVQLDLDQAELDYQGNKGPYAVRIEMCTTTSCSAAPLLVGKVESSFPLVVT